MLKILIVDDEELIRDGIAWKIEHLLPHAKIVGKAEDAQQAMEMVEAHHPDIVITDIRMPEMDGLQLIEQVNSRIEGIRFVLISGYQDFEYARRGIELGVENYLLKPIENEKLLEVLQKLERKINEESYSRKHLHELRDKARDSMDFLRSKYLNDAVNLSGEHDRGIILKALEKMSIKFSSGYYTVITLIADSFDQLPGFPHREDISLVKYAVRNIAEEIFSELGTTAAFESLKRERQVVIILNHENCGDSKILQQCDTLLASLGKFLSITATAGVGRSYDNVNFLHNSYMESYTAALQSMVLESNNVIHIGSVPDSNLVTFFLPENEKLLLFSHINSRNQEKAFEIVDSVFTAIKTHSLSYANIRALYIDIAIMLGKTVKEAGGCWDNIFEEDIFAEDFISRFTNLEQLKGWIKDCIRSICSYLFDLRKSDGKKAIEEIKEYINNYYYTDINFNELSGKYFINPSYLSQLFKNESGEKFTDYLTRVRMEKAKELLSGTRLKSYEVAEMVGYTDPRYFSNVFMRYTGVTPSKYREQ